jgi:uncharacterized protein
VTTDLTKPNYQSCIESSLCRKSTIENPSSESAHSELLEKRLGRLHARLRLGLEDEHEAQVFGQGINYFHFENLHASHLLIGACLKLSGLYWRGRRNAAKIVVVHNDLTSVQVPDTFDGFTILQLSDLHVDLSQDAMEQLTVLLRDATLAGMARVRAALDGPVYGVLGNHDTIKMVPGLEEMGIRMLLNECERIERGGGHIYLAGIDDAHFYRADNIEKAASGIPSDAQSCRRIHRKSIGRPPMPISICCCVGTPTAAKSASQGASRSRSIRCCRGIWDPALGPITIWWATPRRAPVHLSFRCGLTARRKSPCIICIRQPQHRTASGGSTGPGHAN